MLEVQGKPRGSKNAAVLPANSHHSSRGARSEESALDALMARGGKGRCAVKKHVSSIVGQTVSSAARGYVR